MKVIFLNNYLIFGLLTFLLGCQTPLVCPPPTPPGSPPPIYPPKVPSILIESLISKISAECSAAIKTSGNGSSVVCGNVINIFYPPAPGPSGTILHPIVTFLSRNYQWKIGSTTHLEGNSKGLGLLESQLKSPGMQTLMSRSSYLIAIGTASREGTETEESDRAQKRAIEIDAVIRKSLPKDSVLREFYNLQLGK